MQAASSGVHGSHLRFRNFVLSFGDSSHVSCTLQCLSALLLRAPANSRRSAAAAVAAGVMLSLVASDTRFAAGNSIESGIKRRSTPLRAKPYDIARMQEKESQLMASSSVSFSVPYFVHKRDEVLFRSIGTIAS